MILGTTLDDFTFAVFIFFFTVSLFFYPETYTFFFNSLKTTRLGRSRRSLVSIFLFRFPEIARVADHFLLPPDSFTRWRFSKNFVFSSQLFTDFAALTAGVEPNSIRSGEKKNLNLMFLGTFLLTGGHFARRELI